MNEAMALDKLSHLNNDAAISLSLACRDVPRLDLASRTDLFCVIYTKNGGHWCRWGNTETVYGVTSCKWVQKVKICDSVDQEFYFSVYNQNSHEDDLSRHDLIGSANVGFQEVLDSPGKQLSIPLEYMPGHAVYKNRGTLSIAADFLNSEPNTRPFQVSLGLDMKGKYYYEISKAMPCGEFMPAYRSETLKKEGCFFKTLHTHSSKLTGGDSSCQLHLELYHCDASFVSNAEPKFIGYVEFTIDMLFGTLPGCQSDCTKLDWKVPQVSADGKKKNSILKADKCNSVLAVLTHELSEDVHVFNIRLLAIKGERGARLGRWLNG